MLEGDDNWQLELLFTSNFLLELLKLMVQATSLQPSSSNEIEGNDDNIEVKLITTWYINTSWWMKNFKCHKTKMQ